MPSIVDTIYEVGYPLLYLPMHHVGGRVSKLAGCEYAGTPVATAIGSASPSNLTENVADFDGASSEIEIPNLGDLLTGKSNVSMAAWASFDALPSGAHRICVMDKGPAVTMFSAYRFSSNLYYFGRPLTSDGGANSMIAPALATGTNYAISCGVSVLKKTAYIRLGATEIGVDHGSMSLRAIEDMSGQSLFIGSHGIGGGFHQGTIHSLAIWVGCEVSEQQHLALNAATTLGQWCNLDLGGDPIQSGGVNYTGSNLEYSLRKGGPDGLLLDQGTDLAITAGVCSREFYVPEAGSDYWLNINDTANGLVGAGRQVALASV